MTNEIEADFSLLCSSLLPAGWNVDKMAGAQAAILDPEVESTGYRCWRDEKEEPGDCRGATSPLISCICMRAKAMSAVLNISILTHKVLLCNFQMSVTAQSDPTKWASVAPHR